MEKDKPGVLKDIIDAFENWWTITSLVAIVAAVILFGDSINSETLVVIGTVVGILGGFIVKNTKSNKD